MHYLPIVDYQRYCRFRLVLARGGSHHSLHLEISSVVIVTISSLPTLRTFIRDQGPSYTEGIQTEGRLVSGETKLSLEVLRSSNAHHRVIRHQSGPALRLEQSEVIKS